MGRLADAERIAPAGPRWRDDSVQRGRRCRAFAGHVAAERGEFELAEQLLERAWALMQRSGGFQLIGPACAWRVLLDLDRGELDLARGRLAEGLSLVRGLGRRT